jgi:hypothetical protein
VARLIPGSLLQEGQQLGADVGPPGANGSGAARLQQGVQGHAKGGGTVKLCFQALRVHQKVVQVEVVVALQSRLTRCTQMRKGFTKMVAKEGSLASPSSSTLWKDSSYVTAENIALQHAYVPNHLLMGAPDIGSPLTCHLCPRAGHKGVVGEDSTPRHNGGLAGVSIGGLPRDRAQAEQRHHSTQDGSHLHSSKKRDQHSENPPLLCTHSKGCH